MTEEAAIPIIVFITNLKPNIYQFTRTSGTLIRIIITPTGVLNRMFSTVAIPVAPPITISHGTKNILSATANISDASKTVKV